MTESQALAPRRPLPELPARARPATRGALLLRVVPGAAVLGGLLGMVQTTAPWVGVAVVVGAFVGLVARRRRLLARWREHEDALHLLTAGDAPGAHAILGRLCDQARGQPAYHALFSLALAGAELELGEVDLALARLQVVERSGWIDRRRALATFRPILHGRIAMAHALRDEPEQAARALEEALAALPEARRGVLLQVEALVLARAGAMDRALARIEADGARAQQFLPGARFGTIKALQGFAQATLGRSEYRDASAGREALADPLVRRTLEVWAKDWPALAGYLAVAG